MSLEHKCKSPQKYINKLNFKMYKKYILQWSEIYPNMQDARLFQYLRIIYKPPHQQAKIEISYDHIDRWSKSI